jgi:hypothetical protein
MLSLNDLFNRTCLVWFFLNRIASIVHHHVPFDTYGISFDKVLEIQQWHGVLELESLARSDIVLRGVALSFGNFFVETVFFTFDLTKVSTFVANA